MDQALEPLIEMHSWIWKRFKRTLVDLEPDEVDWRPLPQANNINTIVRHLRIEAEWHVDCLERGVAMPAADVTSEVQQWIDSVPMDFDGNLGKLEELYSRFIAQLSALAHDALKQQSTLAYKEFPSTVPAHMLGFHQAVHLSGHLAQISTIRNLYRKTRGERALFFPDNPTYPKQAAVPIE